MAEMELDPDEQLAVVLMQVLDVDEGEPEAWSEGWAVRCLMAGKGAKHFGDCTKAPITCSRCLYDEYVAKAKAARPLLAAIFASEAPNQKE